MGIVALEQEVVVVVIEDGRLVALDGHTWQCARLTRELLGSLVEVVEIEVGIAQRMDKLTSLKDTLPGYHHREQCIRGYIE